LGGGETHYQNVAEGKSKKKKENQPNGKKGKVGRKKIIEERRTSDAKNDVLSCDGCWHNDECHSPEKEERNSSRAPVKTKKKKRRKIIHRGLGIKGPLEMAKIP